MAGSPAENISVFLRLRPLTPAELARSQAWRVAGNSMVRVDAVGVQAAARAPGCNQYSCDAVFDAGQPTAAVYQQTTQGLIQQVVEGFNSTVFAYGQTSSGKTHTMRGNNREPGIIPLAVREVFRLVGACRDRAFQLHVSYLELYNEDLIDLLSSRRQQRLELRERGGVAFVDGLQEVSVDSPEQVLQLLESGERHRHYGDTRLNSNSSRSHTIFRLVVQSCGREGAAVGNGAGSVGGSGSSSGSRRVSTLMLVDLAGSERAKKTGSEGQRMREGTSINKSLSALGKVISKLSEGKGDQHIPYRESKLTRMLQPSLGGNSKTAIICTCTTAAVHVEETQSTLRFATRAKCIQNTAVVNDMAPTDADMLREQARRIQELEQALRGSSGSGGSEADPRAHHAAAAAERERALKEEVARLQGQVQQLGAGEVQWRREKQLMANENEELWKSLECMSNARSGAEQEMRGMQQQVAEGAAARALLEQQLAEAQEQLSSLQRLLEESRDLGQGMGAAELKIDRLKVDLAESQVRVAHLQQAEAALSAALAAEKAQWKEDRQHIMRQCEHFRQQLESAAQSLAALRQVNQQLEQQVAQERAARRKLEQQLAQAQAHLEAQQQHAAKENVQQQLAAAAEDKQLREELAAKTAALAELRRETRSLRAQLMQQKVSSTGGGEGALGAAGGAGHHASSAAAAAEDAPLVARLRGRQPHQERLDQLEKTLTSREAMVAQLQAQLGARGQRVEHLEWQNKQLTEQLRLMEVKQAQHRQQQSQQHQQQAGGVPAGSAPALNASTEPAGTPGKRRRLYAALAGRAKRGKADGLQHLGRVGIAPMNRQ